MFNIAIDGPAGAGKSSIAKEVSKRLGYIYVDTGALYRTVAYNALQNGASLEDAEAVKATLSDTKISLAFEDGTQKVLLNGNDVSDVIRTNEVSAGASKVSAIPEVRTYLFDLQQDIAKNNDCLMDGRDIGTVVLPNADLKVYLTASAEERARRRCKQNEEKGIPADFDTILKEVNERDERDMNREIAPLKQAEDAVLLDTTDMNFEQVVEKLLALVAEKQVKAAPEAEKAEQKKPVKKPTMEIKKSKRLPFQDDKEYHHNWNKEIKKHPITWKVSFPLAKLILNKRFNKVTYINPENVPKDGPFILCANHVNGFDPITIAYGTGGKREMYFMAKEEFYHTFYTRWALNVWNGIPVSRGTADRDCIEFCKRVINKGFGLVVFPQGTRDKEGKRPYGFKAGSAMIARECHAPVVPVSVHKFQAPGEKKATLVVRYGEVIPYEELGFTEGSRKSKELRKATALIEDRVAELWDEDLK